MPPAATTSGQALTNLQNYAGGMQSPDQALQTEQQNLGTTAAQQTVTGLRGAITNTTNLLNQVAPSVMGRTQGSLVTSAQADKQISNEQAPLNTQLDTENTNYNSANQDYTNLEQQAETLANADVSSQQNQESYLQNIYNNLYKQESDAASAATQEKQFEQQLAASQAASASSAATSPSLVGGASTAATDPNQAVASLFTGYKPGQDQYYTENVVIPTLESQLGMSSAAASKLAYQYRKATFGN